MIYQRVTDLDGTESEDFNVNTEVGEFDVAKSRGQHSREEITECEDTPANFRRVRLRLPWRFVLFDLEGEFNVDKETLSVAMERQKTHNKRLDEELKRTQEELRKTAYVTPQPERI